MTYFTTIVYVRLLGFAIYCSLTHNVSLIICFCSFNHTFAACFLQILNYSRHPCFWLTIPIGWLVVDFHPLDIKHAWRTLKRALTISVKALNYESVNSYVARFTNLQIRGCIILHFSIIAFNQLIPVNLYDCCSTFYWRTFWISGIACSWVYY